MADVVDRLTVTRGVMIHCAESGAAFDEGPEAESYQEKLQAAMNDIEAEMQEQVKLFEGQGKLIEALRFGVPVVTTSAGAQGLPEPENYVSVGDTPQLFAERIIEMVENPRLAQPRVLRGLDYIQREFAYSSVAARMAEFRTSRIAIAPKTVITAMATPMINIARRWRMDTSTFKRRPRLQRFPAASPSASRTQ